MVPFVVGYCRKFRQNQGRRDAALMGRRTAQVSLI